MSTEAAAIAKSNRRLLVVELAKFTKDKRINAELRELAARFGMGDPEINLFAQAVKEGKAAADPSTWFEALKVERDLARDYPVLAAELANVQNMRGSHLPGTTVPHDARLPLSPYGETAFQRFEARNGNAIQARGLTLQAEGPSSARIGCRSCGATWAISTAAPLEAASLVCPAGCNRTSGLHW